MIKRDTKFLRIGATTVLMVLIIVRILIYAGTRHVVATNEQVEKSAAILAAIGSLETSLNEAQASVRDYDSAGDEKTLEPFQKTLADIPKLVQRIRVLTANDPAQLAQLRILDPGVTALLQRDLSLIRQRRRRGLR